MKKLLKISLTSFILIFVVLFLLFGGKISLFYSIFKKYNVNKDLINSTSFENTNQNQNVTKEIIYKNTNNIPLSLDLYEPNKTLSKGSPVVIYVHGGSWAYGNKTLPQVFTPILDSFRDEGYTIISVEYELLGKSLNFNKQVSDIKDCIRWINKNKDIYNFNTDEIGIIGVSAGAHLGLLAAYSDRDDFIDDKELSEFPSNIKYIIDFFGPTNLSTFDTNIAPEVIGLPLPSIDNKQEFISKYSPINYIKGDLPRTLIIHSKNDTLVPYDNSLTLYNKSKSFNNSVELLTLEDMDHDLSNLTTETTKKIGLKTLKFIISNSPL